MANDFFNDLGESLSKRAQGIGEKFGSVYELQKIRNQISGEERIIEKTMADIGRVIYSRYKAGEDIGEEFAEQCDEIMSHEKQIDALQQKIADKKGKKICPQCKKSVDLCYSYCPFCGSEVPEQEPTVSEEAPEEEPAAEASEPEKVSGEVVNNEDIEEDALQEDETEGEADSAEEEAPVEEADPAETAETETEDESKSEEE